MKTIKKERTQGRTLKHTVEYIQRLVDGTLELRTQVIYACNSQEMKDKKRKLVCSLRYNEVGIVKRNIITGKVSCGKVAYK